MNTKLQEYEIKKNNLSNQLEALRAELADKRAAYSRDLRNQALAEAIAGLQIREGGLIQACEQADAAVRGEQERMQSKEALKAGKDADRLQSEIERDCEKIVSDIKAITAANQAVIFKQGQMNKLLSLAGRKLEFDTTPARFAGYLSGWLARITNDGQLAFSAYWGAAKTKTDYQKQAAENEARAAEMRKKPGYIAHRPVR